MQTVAAIEKKTESKIRPIIKWTGGKFEEFQMFSAHIPAFDRYFEPFFGGGGVFFALQPKTESFLNDKSSDLVNFYSLVDSAKLQKELMLYADAWDEAGELAIEFQEKLLGYFKEFIAGKMNADPFENGVQEMVGENLVQGKYVLLDPDFIIDPVRFRKKLNASIIDKCRRIKAISIKGNRRFSDVELCNHIETGIKSGLYLFVRELMNLKYQGRLEISDAKAVANWYFVREFCYASMFRYNSKGGFNIPYGGIAYNKKNFRLKVENIFSKKCRKLFEKSTFYNLDFADFLLQTNPNENDFIFLDPPYDSEFSEYDQNTFTKNDQIRLRDALLQMTAKWMLVIKETNFITNLYSFPQCRFTHFDKTYTYNVRGRNNRDTKHLIITNY